MSIERAHGIFDEQGTVEFLLLFGEKILPMFFDLRMSDVSTQFEPVSISMLAFILLRREAKYSRHPFNKSSLLFGIDPFWSRTLDASAF